MFDALKNISCTDRLLRRMPIAYSRAVNLIQTIETSGLQERAFLQQNRTAKILRIARNLPGYSGVNIGNRLEDWPILTKDDIQGHEADFAVRTFYPTPSAESGGTTGMPLRLKRSAASITFEQAIVDRLTAQVGIDGRNARVAVLKADNLEPELIASGHYWYDVGNKKRVYSSHHICAATAQAYKRSLIDFAPDILFCYPSSVETLIHYFGQDCGVTIPLVFTSSEILNSATRDLIREQLNCDLIDFYGHAERLVSAYSINGSPYRFLPSYGLAELLPCGDGLARIIGTTLRDSGQVLVRYDTCDVAKVPSQDPHILKQISLGLLPFDGILGRNNEFVDLPDGRRIHMLNMVARGADGARSIQFRYDGHKRIDIYIVPGFDFGSATCDRILRNFYSKFPSYMNAHLWSVTTRICEPNGKAPLMLRNPLLPEVITSVATSSESSIAVSPPATAAA